MRGAVGDLDLSGKPLLVFAIQTIATMIYHIAAYESTSSLRYCGRRNL